MTRNNRPLHVRKLSSACLAGAAVMAVLVLAGCAEGVPPDTSPRYRDMRGSGSEARTLEHMRMVAN